MAMACRTAEESRSRPRAGKSGDAAPGAVPSKVYRTTAPESAAAAIRRVSGKIRPLGVTIGAPSRRRNCQRAVSLERAPETARALRTPVPRITRESAYLVGPAAGAGPEAGGSTSQY